MILLLLTLWGCGLGQDWSARTSAQSVFPHGADYEQGAVHGADALARGTAACVDCHDGPDATPTATPCAECHADWPHPDGFVDGAVHGAGTWGDGAGVESCAECHATPGLVASSTYACDSCHQSWPHPPGWEASGQHGVYAVDRGSAVAACGSCHGTDLGGGRIGVGCDDCHQGWPHAEGFADPAVHGAAHLEGGGCLDCHGAAGDGTAAPDGAATGVACARCHDTYPHPTDFTAAHVAQARSRGEATCMTCHDPGDGPDRGPVVASCAESCHGGAE